MKERAYPVYTVNKHAEGLLVGGHPWVYENDILNSPENEPENGTLADVVSTKGSYLGTGFVSLKSKIRVRLISRNANDTFDAAFWRRRVEYAWSYRKTVLEPADLSACRVIFGEADQFPGLTVDRFSNILVTQTLSVGMEKLKPILFPILAEVLRADGQTIDGIYERNDEALRARFQKTFVGYQQIVNAEQQKVVQQINGLMQKTLEDFRTKNGYSVIMNAEGLLAFDPKSDVTKDVIAEMDKTKVTFAPVKLEPITAAPKADDKAAPKADAKPEAKK